MNQGRIYSSIVTNINGDISAKETAVKYNDKDIRGIENVNGHVQPIPKQQLNSMLKKMKSTRPRSRSLSQTQDFFPNIQDKINLIVQELSPHMMNMDMDMGNTTIPYRKQLRNFRKSTIHNNKKKIGQSVKITHKKRKSHTTKSELDKKPYTDIQVKSRKSRKKNKNKNKNKSTPTKKQTRR